MLYTLFPAALYCGQLSPNLVPSIVVPAACDFGTGGSHRRALMGGSANGTPRNWATPGAIASSINPLTVPTVVLIERLDEVTFGLARESHIGKRRSLKSMIMRVN